MQALTWMLKISRGVRTGKIVQIRTGLRPYLNGGYTVIQTFGTPLEHAVLCGNRLKIRDALSRYQTKGVVIVSVSTVDVDEEFVGWLRFFTYSGHNVYVYSFSVRKQWYVDDVV